MPLRIGRMGPLAAKLLSMGAGGRDGAVACTARADARTYGSNPTPTSRSICQSIATARVAAVFDRSLYIEADRALVCVGAASIGNGPVNAVINDSGWTSLAALVDPGETVVLSGCGLQGSRWSLDASMASVWRPPAWSPVAGQRALIEATTHLVRLAEELAPPDGLAPLLLRARSGCAGAAFDRVAGPRVDALAHWLARRLDPGVAGEEPPPVDLLGLGPGLTPSGDDALCGALLALDALGARTPRDMLASAVLAAAPAATTPLSACFLAAAAQGLGSEALHDFIAALVSADLGVLAPATAALGRIGHSSGWDALAGVLLVVRAQAAAHRPTRSP